jgi:DNA-binding PadR family transcriptional regulator
MERRGYGYEIAQRLSERLGPQFAVPDGTVHSAIKSLHRAGEIEIIRRTLRGDQVAVWYGTNHRGARTFETWLDAPLTREPLRDDLYLKFAMVDVRRLPKFRAEFERLELECMAEIAALTHGRPLADEMADPVSWHTASRLLLDSRALDYLNGDLAFIRRTVGVLRWAEAQDDGAVPRATLLEAVS